MSKISNATVLLVVLGAVFSATGCVTPNEACIKTVAARASSNALLADATLSLQQAENVIAHISNPKVRDEALAQLDKARDALRWASERLSDVDSMCKALDNQELFARFVAAWAKIVPFVSAFAGPNGQPLVATPLVVTR